jgi:predicted metal-dependent phosphoesterase TrpH
LEEVIVFSKKRGLDGIAITDHNTIDGALQLIPITKLIVIPGIEISTQEGHVLALNVTTPIPPKLSRAETICRIHKEGGIAIAPHPMSAYRGGSRIQTTSKLDAIEVINSAEFPFMLSTWLNNRLADKLNLPKTAGSDSHMPQTVGLAYTMVNADPEIDEIIHAIKRGKTTPKGKAISWRMRIRKTLLT